MGFSDDEKPKRIGSMKNLGYNSADCLNYSAKEITSHFLEEIVCNNVCDDDYIVSNTKNCKQYVSGLINIYPLAPEGKADGSLLKEYYDIIALSEDALILENKVYFLAVTDAYYDFSSGKIFVVCSGGRDSVKPFSLMTIWANSGCFYHSFRNFLSMDGCMKYFTLAKGEKWTGGDTVDDFC